MADFSTLSRRCTRADWKKLYAMHRSFRNERMLYLGGFRLKFDRVPGIIEVNRNGIYSFFPKMPPIKIYEMVKIDLTAHKKIMVT